jgi:hypothetical protein
METENTPNEKPTQELTITDMAAGYINETRKWAQFLAILGFIGAGLIAIMAIFAGSMFSGMIGRRRDRVYCALPTDGALVFLPLTIPL